MATKNLINSNIPIEVSLGGTGATSFASHSVLIGQGTSPISTITVGTDGQVLIAATGADPAFATLSSSGSSIGQTPGAGSLSIDIINSVPVTTWTPVLSFGGGSTGIIYGTRFARYSRLGSLVFIYGTMPLTNKGTDVGNMSIDTLPVAVASGKSFALNCIVSNGVYVGQVVGLATGTSIVFYDSVTLLAAAQMTNANCLNATQLFFTGYYFA